MNTVTVRGGGQYTGQPEKLSDAMPELISVSKAKLLSMTASA